VYWWKIDAVVAELKSGTMSENQKMKYLLADSVLIGLSAMFARQGNVFDLAVGLVVLALTVGGILVCFSANGANNGRDFVERFVCLSFPVTIRLTVFGFPALIILFIVAGMLTGGSTEGILQRLVYFAWSVAFTVAYFLWIRSKLRSVSSA